MNISVSPDVMSPTISAPHSGSRPPSPPVGDGQGGPSGRASAIESMGGPLTDGVNGSLLAGAAKLEASGASFEEIRSFVDGELEANGVDTSGGDQRSGQLVDMMS
jgi:hypothetical protein